MKRVSLRSTLMLLLVASFFLTVAIFLSPQPTVVRASVDEDVWSCVCWKTYACGSCYVGFSPGYKQEYFDCTCSETQSCYNCSYLNWTCIDWPCN